MEYRKIGSSDLEVSLVGLGCNNFGGRLDTEATATVVHKALDAGITLFDTADIYGDRGGSELMLGKALGSRRKDIVLATKFGMAMDDRKNVARASRDYIKSAVEASLKRLGTDWIDLYQLHQPDPLTPVEETLRALDELIQEGKVRYIGCSKLPAWQVVESEWTARSEGLQPFICCQDEYSLLVRQIEAELIPAMRAYGMGLIPYFPLASGLLTGKYKRDAAMPKGARLSDTPSLTDRYMTPRNWDKLAILEGFCDEHGTTMLELAFAWLASKPLVASIIAGATKPEQIEQNVKAADRTLSETELAALDSALTKV